MFGFSLGELLLIVVVAVVCIGPKELPAVIRGIARAMRMLRELTGELRAAFDDLARESGITEATDELKREVKTITGDDGKPYTAYNIDDFVKKDDGRPRG